MEKETREKIGQNTLEYRKAEYGIIQLLKKHSIPIHLWDKGEAKTVDRLVAEIIEGDSVLQVFNGELVRKLRCVDVEVTHNYLGQELRLKEAKQVFPDGRERHRDYYGVSEKIVLGEDLFKGTQRALQEELSISKEITEKELGITFVDELFEQLTSQSYPGLTTHYTVYKMKAELPPSEFNPEGYIEEAENLITYFVWEEVE